MWPKPTKALIRSILFSFMFAKEKKKKKWCGARRGKKKVLASTITGNELLSRKDEISDFSVNFNALVPF